MIFGELGRPLLLVVLATTPLVAEEPAAPRALPISAHNCYPHDGIGEDRLAHALALGIDNIEIDLGWDAEKGRLIVGHDDEPREGISYPGLEEYVLPALEGHWTHPRADGAPSVLTVDWKTTRPEAVRRFAQFLDAHPEWFSTAPKASPSPLTRRKLTVCFTGSDAAKDAYDAMIPDGGTYRAFRDRVHGGGDYRKDVSEYSKDAATAYCRFLTFHWGVIERGGPPLAGAWTEGEAARLAELVAGAHRQGYRVRFYCLDGHTGPLVSPYRFRNDSIARGRWLAAARVGVDWIASDEYDVIAEALRSADRAHP